MRPDFDLQRLCETRPNTVTSYFRCKTYKQLASKFAQASERVRTSAPVDGLMSDFTCGYKKEVDPVIVAKVAEEMGFDNEWLAKKKAKALAK